MVAGVAMGMTLSPLIWMTGVSIFSTLTTEKRRVSLILGYIVTFVDFTAIIVSMVFLEKYFSLGDSNKDSTAHNYHVIAYLVATFSTYIYFLLFFVLVIRYRRFVSRKIMVTLIIFGILNGVRLFGETAFMLYATRLLFPGMVYTYFIITDFFSVISLYMSTVFWKGLLYTESVSDLQK
jgi:hypothetical protein